MFTTGALGTQPYPCALSDIPSWRLRDAEPVATAAAHQCRAHRGPRPAEPHPRSPAVKTGNREWRLRHRFTARQLKLGGWGVRRREGTQAAKLVHQDVQPYSAWEVKGLALNPRLLIPTPALVPCHLPLGQMRTVAHNPSPHQTHFRSLESGQSKHLVE